MTRRELLRYLEDMTEDHDEPFSFSDLLDDMATLGIPGAAEAYRFHMEGFK